MKGGSSESACRGLRDKAPFQSFDEGPAIPAPAPFFHQRSGAQITRDLLQAIITGARHLRQQGHSLRAIASALADSGRYARNGKVFEAMQVRAMLL